MLSIRRPAMPRFSDATGWDRFRKRRTIENRWETAHAHLATGRMVKAARFFARRRGRCARPMDRAGGPDRRRREGRLSADMAAQVGVALKRIIKLLAEAGAGPEHIVRLTWYLTSRERI